MRLYVPYEAKDGPAFDDWLARFTLKLLKVEPDALVRVEEMGAGRIVTVERVARQEESRCDRPSR